MATSTGEDEEKEKLLPVSSAFDLYTTIQPTDRDRGTVLTRRISDTRLSTVSCSVLVALTGSLLSGYAMGYSSPVINDLQLSESYNASAPNGEELKYGYRGIFSALLPLGAIIGSLLAGWLVELVGLKFSLFLCSVPFSVGWLVSFLCIYFTIEYLTVIRALLFTGRFIVGIGVGSVSVCVPLYIAEISPPTLRGFYGAAHQLVFTIGLFLVEIIGAYVSYYWLPVLPLVINFGFTICSTRLKETPRWLISRGNNEKAGMVLLWLRGSTYDIVDEQREIEDQIQSGQVLSFSEILKQLRNKPVYHPLILALFLMFFQQFTGINAIVYNAEGIFVGATGFPGLVSSLTVGLTQVVTTFISVILTDVVGRRILLISGAVIMCGGISLAGGYEYLVRADDIDNKNYFAMIATGIVLYNFGFSIGWGALPWLLTSEIIPLRVRGTGVGIVTFLNWSFAAFVTGEYYYFQLQINPWSMFWTFGFFCLVAAVFVALFIPETKGRSLEDIERSFEASLHRLSVH